MKKAPFSFKLNGQYLDDLVHGYQTKYVKGREVSDIEFEYTDNITDGARFDSKRIPPKILDIDYIIVCDSYADKMIKTNLLNKYINKKDMRIEFDDEPNTYRTASYYGHTEELNGKTLEGTITLICLDPFKYSRTTKTINGVTESDGVYLSIHNDGNYRAPIDFTVTNNSSNGFVGISNGIQSLQYGYVGDNSADDETQYIMNFASAEDIYTNIIKGGTVPSGYINNDTLRLQERNDTTYVGYSGSATHSTSWHGYNGYIDIPTAQQTDEPIILDSGWWINETKNEFTGGMSMSIDFDNGDTASIEIWNSSESTITNTVSLKLKGVEVSRLNFDANSTAWSSAPYGRIQIEKAYDRITFVFNSKRIMAMADSLSTAKITRVNFGFWQKNGKTYSTVGWYLLHDFNIKLMYADASDRYQSGDVIRVVGDEGKMYVNDIYKPRDEVIGSKYFDAPVGDSAVVVTVSDGATPPTVTAEIRERWL